MSFKSGSISLRFYYMDGDLPESVISRLADNHIPSLDHLGKGAINGWATSRHILDSNITDDRAHYAGYLTLSLTKAERVIPPALLRAEVAMEEEAEKKALDVEYLPRAARSEIRKAVTERLLPQMPPALSATHFVAFPESRLIVATCCNTGQEDLFCMQFRNATGVGLFPVTPVTMALSKHKQDPRDLLALFIGGQGELVSSNPGADFLTWLWYFAEDQGGHIAATATVPELGVMIEGPLTLESDGEGAHVCQLSHGSPESSAEARIALSSGKRLSKAKVTLCMGEEITACVFDAETFTFRSVLLPKSESLDSYSKFQDRMISIQRLHDSFVTLYGMALKALAEPGVSKDIREWVDHKSARH